MIESFIRVSPHYVCRKYIDRVLGLSVPVRIGDKLQHVCLLQRFTDPIRNLIFLDYKTAN